MKKPRSRQNLLARKSTVPRIRRDPQTLAAGLQRLAQAIAATPTTDISHDQCESQLEFYVDAERRKENARVLYPIIWKHLQNCDRCALSYQLLNESIAEDAPSNSITPVVVPSMPTLPFLVPPSTDSLWIKKICSSVGGAPLGFAFAIPANYLQQRLAASQALLVRDENVEPGKTLLLADTITLGRHDVAVKLWLRQPTPSDHAQIEISLASSVPLPEPLRITLRLNSHKYSRVLRQGQCTIKNIPLASLRDAGLFHVNFQAGSLSANIEDVRVETR